jgi:hypothetical protein
MIRATWCHPARTHTLAAILVTFFAAQAPLGAIAREVREAATATAMAPIDQYLKKEFGPPDVGEMSYMMSKEQYLGDRFHHWRPHLMFYVPGTVQGSDWGANLARSPVVVGPEKLPNGDREPVLVFVVPVVEWSDGTRAADGHD